jgi:hypothetical protein
MVMVLDHKNILDNNFFLLYIGTNERKIIDRGGTDGNNSFQPGKKR